MQIIEKIGPLGIIWGETFGWLTSVSGWSNLDRAAKAVREARWVGRFWHHIGGLDWNSGCQYLGQQAMNLGNQPWLPQASLQLSSSIFVSGEALIFSIGGFKISVGWACGWCRNLNIYLYLLHIYYIIELYTYMSGQVWCVHFSVGWLSSSPTVLLRFMDGSIDPRFNWLQDLSGKISGKNRGWYGYLTEHDFRLKIRIWLKFLGCFACRFAVHCRFKSTHHLTWFHHDLVG